MAATAANPKRRSSPMDCMSWFGTVSDHPEGVHQRLVKQFPADSRVAVSITVGDWSHDLMILKVEEIKQIGENHFTFVTDRSVFGLSGGDQIGFDHDYRGARLEVLKTNGAGEPIRWIFLAID